MCAPAWGDPEFGWSNTEEEDFREGQACDPEPLPDRATRDYVSIQAELEADVVLALRAAAPVSFCHLVTVNCTVVVLVSLPLAPLMVTV